MSNNQIIFNIKNFNKKSGSTFFFEQMAKMGTEALKWKKGKKYFQIVLDRVAEKSLA
jgi:hypothetical protein